ncbi:hypothetical protein [Tropheryma whipplei]|uniref:Cell division protein FtsL n=3 Tax=Tropheryma whipplei TaxID=2039 RepID=Q83GN6_TROWT|nr:hypothetical protein [Tropheryma whipplei]AAO44318.1 unknown [Tropheryma whipplei str. Twist]CAD67215.1 putative membrane protein [Tropheryma whipplei TW08/27]
MMYRVSDIRYKRLVMFAATLVVVFVISQLALSSVSGSYAFHVNKLRNESQTLLLDKSEAQRQIAVYSSPQYLVSRLRELGMTGSMHPAYLRLSDGSVLGKPSVVNINDSFDMGNLVSNDLLSGIPKVIHTVDEKQLAGLLSQMLFPAPLTN